MNENNFQNLTAYGIISRLHYYDEVGSTNDEAKKTAYTNSLTNGYELYVADTQSVGRGRMGRTWSSPPGTNISMSLLTNTKLSGELIPGITILAALAVYKGIQRYTQAHKMTSYDLKIKWPNDLVINGKKICGILTELIYPYVICGIGINVNTPDFPDDIRDKATSLMLETISGHEIDRAELICIITKDLISYIDLYETKKSLDFITEEYNSLLVSLNKEIILTSDNIELPSGTYISRGIDSSGALIAENKVGEVICVRSGEVSVRGLYGYT